MAKRRPVQRVVYTKEVFYGSGRRSLPKQKWPWPSIGAVVVAVAVLPREPLISLLICVVAIYLWRRNVRARG